MRLIACIEEPDVAKGILEHLGLRAETLTWHSLRAAGRGACSMPDPRQG